VVISELKKTLISSRLGRRIDSILRLVLSTIPLAHSVMSQKKNHKTPDVFVFFTYGGIGDVVLILPLVKKISISSTVIILCDERIAHLSFMFPPDAQIEVYDKNIFAKSIRRLKRKIPLGEAIFVQTSPIIELYVVRILLGIPKAVGFVSSFKTFRSIGFYSKKISADGKNKNSNYDNLYKYISISLSLFISNDVEGVNEKPVTEGYDYKYIVISPMKSFDWDMGKMDSIEYIKTAEHFIKHFGYKVIFVGSAGEYQAIASMIKLSKMHSMMVNMAGKTSLEDLSAILSHAQFIIANDNGIGHISAYFKLRVLVLFMFSDPHVYLWHNVNYAYIFNKSHSCMPCVGISQYPKDNYPPFCPNKLVCNKTINHIDILEKIKHLEWC